MKTAAMASNSKLTPSLGLVVFTYAVKTIPATPDSKPMLTMTSIRLVFTPEGPAARELPPTE